MAAPRNTEPTATEAETPAPPVVVAQPAQTVTLPVRMTPKVDPRQAFRAGSKASAGVVVGAEPGYQYTYVTGSECRTPQEFQARRQRLVDGGWEPRSGPLYTGPMTSEYVPDQPDAEIWRRTHEVEGFEWLRDLCECMKMELWTSLYLRGSHWLPQPVHEALLAYHGLVPLPSGVPKPTLEQVFDLTWQHVKPHPGAVKQPKFAWLQGREKK
jgi:hypothetical protein